MNIDAFRCMHNGIHRSNLNKKDLGLLAPINQRSKNNQRALLLLHGFSSTPAVFRNLLPALNTYDAIVCPALPGHVENLETFAKVKATDWLKTAEKSCEILKQEYNQVDVLGLSLGGLLACHLSSHFKLNHLYLLAPALDLHLPINPYLRLARILNNLGFRKIRSSAGNIYSTADCEIAYRQLPISAIMEILTFIQQFQFSAPNCPTDLFLGCHDQVVESERVAARFAEQSHINIHWLENSAHLIPLDGDLHCLVDCIQKNNNNTGPIAP